MKKDKFKKVSILGVGLIGGSLGMAIKKKGLSKKVSGLTRRKSSLVNAKALKVIDEGTLSIKKASMDADLIIICTPAKMIPKIVCKVLPFVKDGCIITDVASTKKEIVEEIENMLPDNIYFIGGHPMAGSEKRGVKFASSNLFKGAVCILTKTSKTDLESLNKMKDFWHNLGSRVIILTPGAHDEIVARVSHLPHLAAVALVNQLKKEDTVFVSSGFRDTTRVSDTAEDVWRDIYLSNQKEIIRALDVYINILKGMKKKIKNSDSSGIISEFTKAKRIKKIIRSEKGPDCSY